MKPTMLRQGDVLIVRVAKLPKGADLGPVETVTLAYGEVTGHAHTVAKGRAVRERGDVTYLTVEELTEVRHQEHAPLTLEPGVYRVVRQREVTDDDEGWGRVAD